MQQSRGVLLAATSALALFGALPASAQSGPSEGKGPGVAEDAESATTSGLDSGGIVVTGSRISSAGFQAPTPVTAVQTEDLLQRQPSTLADALYQLPAFQNSTNVNQQQSTQLTRGRMGNYLNLRALGTQRVLVLQDGQRLPPTGSSGGVDASLIPQLLTQRIDIVTGGASAAYGSDAVSGVVNFILDKKFQGLKGQAQAGIADDGHNGSYRLGIAGGISFLEDRLHLIASAETYHSDKILKSAIPSVGESWGPIGLGTAADPIRYVNGLRFSNTSAGGLIRTGPLAGWQFVDGGSTVPYDFGTPAGVSGFQFGGDGPIYGQQCCTITPEQNHTQIFSRAQFDITNSINAFVSVGYNFSKNSDHPSVFFRDNIVIFRENPFLAPETVRALGSTASFTINKQDSTVAPINAEQNSYSTIINTGLEGKIGESLTWQLGYSRGRTKFETISEDIENARFYAAVDAVRDSNNNIVCRVGITNPGLYPDCVPINLLGPNGVTAEMRDYLFTENEYQVRNELDSAQLSISGDLFDLWAGPLSFAVGGEWRRQSLDQRSNSDPAISPDFTGLRGVPSSTTNRWRLTNQSTAGGEYFVKEAFAELNLPVLRDSFVGSLELNGALRLTDYSTSGTVTTWKAGALFDPVPGIRFRGTMSRDIRAPTLFELFSGQSASSLRFLDTLTNTTNTTRLLSGGNPDLTPEIARTMTAGIVIGPDVVDGLNLSIDYFRISISDAIGVPYTAQQIIDICGASGNTSPVCNAITRPLGPTNTTPENFPSEVRTVNQNIARVKLSGIDLDLRYRVPIFDGRLTLGAQATRALTFSQQNSAGDTVRDLLGTSDYVDFSNNIPLPKWRGTFSLTYDVEPLTLFAQHRLIGGFERSRQLVYADNDIGSVSYFDASVIFRVPYDDGRFELFTTVNNLFDRAPPIIPVSRTPGLTVPTMRNTYDIIGRYITTGVRMRI